MPEPQFHIPASLFVQAMRTAKVDYVVTVPDWVQLALHLHLEKEDTGITQITCSNEDQAVCIAAGLRLAGRNPIILVQNQGIYGCVNSIRAIGLDAAQPLIFLIGQFGREFANFGHSAAESRRNTVRYLEPVLDAMDVRYWHLEHSQDMPAFAQAFDYALSQNKPAALIVGAPTAWN